MKDSGRHIQLIVAAISAALLGMLSLQGYLLWSAYQTKQQAFDRNVINVLSTVSQRLEKEEAGEKILNAAVQVSSPEIGKRTVHRLLKDTGSVSSAWCRIDSGMPQPRMTKIVMVHASPRDTNSNFSVKTDLRTGGGKGASTFQYGYVSDESHVTVRTTIGDSNFFSITNTTKKQKDEIVSQVVDKLFTAERLPFQKRVDMKRLDSIIRQSLDAAAITIPFGFYVRVGAKDSICPPAYENLKSRTEGTSFHAQLFPNDIISPGYELVLMLPEKQTYVMRQIAALLVLSLLFSATIILSFVYTVRTIYRQQHFASSVIDFINNMTHEFKTPISTIALASEAIARPDVMKSKKKILKYNSVIGDENVRMKQQVEKILQMAVLEEGETSFKLESVDMHDLIARAVHTISVQIDQRNGSIVQELKAAAPTVIGDRLHLSNVLSTILDNAIKYSPAHPAIQIETESSVSRFVLRIRDKGIGMSKQDVSRVFDKYYRVSTGNTHDVKGFGLGLSYVKLIVDAHRGSIVLESSPGSGTTVELSLPLMLS